MCFNGNFMEPWQDDEKRESKLVFIGKNLDKKALTKAFISCLATPEMHQKKLQSLRFGVGDKIKIKGSREDSPWTDGEIMSLLYREKDMPPGEVANYQIKLASGDVIY